VLHVAVVDVTICCHCSYVRPPNVLTISVRFACISQNAVVSWMCSRKQGRLISLDEIDSRLTRKNVRGSVRKQE